MRRGPLCHLWVIDQRDCLGEQWAMVRIAVMLAVVSQPLSIKTV